MRNKKIKRFTTIMPKIKGMDTPRGDLTTREEEKEYPALTETNPSTEACPEQITSTIQQDRFLHVTFVSASCTGQENVHTKTR